MKFILFFLIAIFSIRANAVCTVGSANGLVNVIGTLGNTGTAPFDSDPADVACAAGSTLHTEGLDCSATNRVVRIGQQTIYPVTVTTTGDSDTNIRLTLTLTNGTWASPLPAVCLAGSSGANTATALCVLGTGSAVLGAGTGIGSGVINFTANNSTNSSRLQQQTMTVAASSTCHPAGAGVTIASPLSVEISAAPSQPELIKVSPVDHPNCSYPSYTNATDGEIISYNGVNGRLITFRMYIKENSPYDYVERPSSITFQDNLSGFPASGANVVFVRTFPTANTFVTATQTGGVGTPVSINYNLRTNSVLLASSAGVGTSTCAQQLNGGGAHHVALLARTSFGRKLEHFYSTFYS